MERRMPVAPRINALQRLWLREMGIEKVWAEHAAVREPTDDAVASAVAPRSASAVLTTPRASTVPTASKSANASTPSAQEQTVASAEALHRATLEELGDQVRSCTACGLCQNRRYAVFGMGAPSAHWLVVGEGPGEQEDRQGLPFVGRSGQLLDAMLASVGMSRKSNVYITNVIKCRPPGNRNPKPEEIAACSPYLRRQIDLLKPERILVVGRFAAQTLLGTDATIGSLRGRVHTFKSDDGRAIPLVVSYHPAYLLRSPLEKARAWQDLRLAAGLR